MCMVNKKIESFHPARRCRHGPSRICFIFCLLIPGLFYLTAATNTANAATYYLDAVNGNDSNPGTSGLPWKTINRAAPQASYDPNVVSGDTVILRGGYYGKVDGTGDWDNDNTDWITYVAEDAVDDPPLFQQIILSRSPNIDAYLSFDGIRFPWAVAGVGEVGIDRTYLQAVHLYGANHFKLLNCYIEGNCDLTNGVQGGKGGTGFYARSRTATIATIFLQDILIDNCEITNLSSGITMTDVGDPGGPENNGIIIRNSKIHHLYNDAVQAHSLSSSLFENNEIGDAQIFGNNLIFDENNTSVGTFVIGDTFTQANTGASGTFLYLDSDPVVYNVKGSYGVWDETEIVSSSGGTFTPSNITPQVQHSDLLQIYGDSDADQCVNVTIRRNVFWDSFQFIFLKEMTNVLIENNLCKGLIGSGHMISLTSGCLSGTIRHNTCVSGSTQIAIKSNTIGGEVFDIYNNLITSSLTIGLVAGDTVNVHNNVIGVYTDYDGGSLPETNHSYSEYPMAEETRNAIFVDYDNGDYQLKKISSPVGFAAPNHAPATDILGNLRDAAPDAGCYEYVTSDPNNDPVLQEIGDKSVDEGQELSLTISATDPNGDTITYSATGTAISAGADFNDQTLTFSWTPSYDQAGSYEVRFIASDGTASDSETITITVNNVNRPPVIGAITDQSVNENDILSLSVNAIDPDGGTVTYSVDNLPSGAAFGSQTFTWTPSYSQAGSHDVTFIATDGQAQDSETITITVINVNRPLVLSAIGNKSIYAGDLLTFTLNATDPDGDTITYSVTSLPSGATFGNPSFSWTPDNNQAGSYDVTFTASDGQAQDSEKITITVTADTSAPTVTNLSPQADSIQSPLNTLITLNVEDAGKGVDANTVEIKVNGNLIYDGDNETSAGVYDSTSKQQTVKGVCRRIGNNKAAYKYIYQGNNKFEFDQTLTVTVNAGDLAATTNTMAEYSYSFISEMRSFGENKILHSGSNNENWGPLTTVCDSSGNIWVAWPQGVVGSRDIYVGKLVAGTDSFVNDGIVQVTEDIPDQGNPVIAVDSSDKLYLAWQDNRRGNWDIYVSTFDGTNWSPETMVNELVDDQVDPAPNQTNPAIVIDSSDKAYITYDDDRNGDMDIYITSSSDSFSNKITSLITSATYDQTTPDLAVDSYDTVYVVWADARSWNGNGNPKYDLYGAASDNSWTNILIVTENNQQSSPKISTEADGTVLHFVWLDDTPGDDDIYYATSDGLPLPGNPLTGSSIIDEAGTDQLSPVIATTGSTAGNDLEVFACWRDERNAEDTEAELYAVEITANGTNIYVGNDFTTDDQSQPAIGIDGYGYPYLVWINGRTDICYAGSTFIEPVVLASSTASVSSKTTVGTVLGSITNIDDVSTEILQRAYLCDVKVKISRIRNPQKPPSNNRTFLYEFGPSGTTFSEPVTITIPYNATTLVSSPSAYWYNPLTGLYSQEGITDVEVIQISSGLYALRFKTTHFSIFGGGGPFGVFGGGGGGGGCSMSPDSQASAVELLLPYVGLAVALGALNVRDRRRNKARKTKKSEC